MYLTEDLLDAISSIDKVRELIETVKVSFVVIFFSSDPWPVRKAMDGIIFFFFFFCVFL